MKRLFIIAGAVLAVAAVGAVAVVGWMAITFTDPYVVQPITVLPAPDGSEMGHRVDSGARTLSVVSRAAVVVVTDPGASFRHDVVWLVQKPRTDGSDAPREFKYPMPPNARINPLGSPIPPEIQKVADGNQWG